MHEERPFHTDSTSSSEAQHEKSDLRRFLEQAETARMRVQSEASSPETLKNGWWESLR